MTIDVCNCIVDSMKTLVRFLVLINKTQMTDGIGNSFCSIRDELSSVDRFLENVHKSNEDGPMKPRDYQKIIIDQVCQRQDPYGRIGKAIV